MNDAVSDRRKLNFLCLAQPIARDCDRGRDIGNFLGGVRLVDERLAVARLGAKPWSRANSVKLAFDEALRATGGSLVKYLEFDARRAGVDDKDRVHGRSRSGQGRRLSPRRRVKNRCGTRRHAAAHRIRP